LEDERWRARQDSKLSRGSENRRKVDGFGMKPLVEGGTERQREPAWGSDAHKNSQATGRDQPRPDALAEDARRPDFKRNAVLAVVVRDSSHGGLLSKFPNKPIARHGLLEADATPPSSSTPLPGTWRCKRKRKLDFD
jgi:hypothetical protein